MVPYITDRARERIKQESFPSKDYGLDEDKIRGMVENKNAVRQAVFFILNTERYAHIIYPWSYGIELDDLIGQHKAYVIPEAERRITEALLQDDRITKVDSFCFEQQRTSLSVTFTVHTVYGDFTERKEVIFGV